MAVVSWNPLASSRRLCIRQSIERLSLRLKGRHLFVAREINLFKIANFPVKLCTFFIVFEDFISIIAFILFGFPSMPHWDTMKPKNFLDKTVKTHFIGFSFVLYLRSVLKVFLRLSRWYVSSLLFTNISSTYTSTFLHICWENIRFTNL